MLTGRDSQPSALLDFQLPIANRKSPDPAELCLLPSHFRLQWILWQALIMSVSVAVSPFALANAGTVP
jgi:hypothetical protein